MTTLLYNNELVRVELNEKTKKIIFKKDNQWVAVNEGVFRILMKTIQVDQKFDMKMKIVTNPFCAIEITRLYGHMDLMYCNEGSKVYIAYIKLDEKELCGLAHNHDYIIEHLESRLRNDKLVKIIDTPKTGGDKEENYSTPQVIIPDIAGQTTIEVASLLKSQKNESKKRHASNYRNESQHKKRQVNLLADGAFDLQFNETQQQFAQDISKVCLS